MLVERSVLSTGDPRRSKFGMALGVLPRRAAYSLSLFSFDVIECDEVRQKSTDGARNVVSGVGEREPGQVLTK